MQTLSPGRLISGPRSCCASDAVRRGCIGAAHRLRQRSEPSSSPGWSAATRDIDQARIGSEFCQARAQILTEAAILTIAGGILGCAVAYGLLRVIDTLSTSEINAGAAGIDMRVLLFTFALIGATCLICGFAPAWAMRRPDVNTALKQSAKQAGMNRGSRRIARLLILAEIACSLVLLIGCGLLVRSFIRVLHVPLGFDPEHALIVRTTLNRQRYASPNRRQSVERTIEARLASLPGVSAVGLTTHVPLADERQIGS